MEVVFSRERLQPLENLFGSSLYLYTIGILWMFLSIGISTLFRACEEGEEDGQPYEISIVMIGAYCSGSLEDTSD